MSARRQISWGRLRYWIFGAAAALCAILSGAAANAIKEPTLQLTEYPDISILGDKNGTSLKSWLGEVFKLDKENAQIGDQRLSLALKICKDEGVTTVAGLQTLHDEGLLDRRDQAIVHHARTPKQQSSVGFSLFTITAIKSALETYLPARAEPRRMQEEACVPGIC
jgi:ascorbate-specific PTS system EIIC-type component UlaA